MQMMRQDEDVAGDMKMWQQAVGEAKTNCDTIGQGSK